MIFVVTGARTRLLLHENEKESGKAIEGALKIMLDTIFTISTLVFFVGAVLYVKFCDGLR